MKDLYPTLPEKDYRISRLLRLLIVSFVIAILLVALLIVLIRFVTEGLLDQAYSVRLEFILPSILLIALIFAKILWDAAEGHAPPTKQKPAP